MNKNYNKKWLINCLLDINVDIYKEVELNIYKDHYYLNQIDHLCYSNKESGKFYNILIQMNKHYLIMKITALKVIIIIV